MYDGDLTEPVSRGKCSWRSVDNAAPWKGRYLGGNEIFGRALPQRLDKFRTYPGGDSKVGARELIHIDHTTTAMAGVGGWKDHWEVLPTDQLVLFCIFVF